MDPDDDDEICDALLFMLSRCLSTGMCDDLSTVFILIPDVDVTNE